MVRAAACRPPCQALCNARARACGFSLIPTPSAYCGTWLVVCAQLILFPSLPTPHAIPSLFPQIERKTEPHLPEGASGSERREQVMGPGEEGCWGRFHISVWCHLRWDWPCPRTPFEVFPPSPLTSCMAVMLALQPEHL